MQGKAADEPPRLLHPSMADHYRSNVEDGAGVVDVAGPATLGKRTSIETGPLSAPASTSCYTFDRRVRSLLPPFPAHL